jgi:hypothetical protein
MFSPTFIRHNILIIQIIDCRFLFGLSALARYLFIYDSFIDALCSADYVVFNGRVNIPR